VPLTLTLLHFLVGQVLEPKILGDHMEIPPVTVIISLLFWGSVWGIVGAVISVPLTVAIKVYLQNIDHPATQALAGIIVGDFSFFDVSKLHETHPANHDADDDDDDASRKEETQHLLPHH